LGSIFDYSVENTLRITSIRKMNNKFEQQKEDALKGLFEAKNSGDVDPGMIPLIDYVNSLPDYYTTSTCTGRTSLFYDPGGKLDSGWVGKWHRIASPEEVIKALKEIPSTGRIWFMHEPTIMHIVCRDLARAGSLVELARNNGYKKTGILSYKEDRVLVEVCGTERMDAPVAQEGKALVEDKYIEYLTVLANEKFKKGMQRLSNFEGALHALEGRK
jgi:tRNA wybutosine-synthesizing protein 3